MNTPLLVFGLILTTAGLAQQPQQSAAPAPQADQASAKKPGIIAGSVVNAKTNQPVRRVNLTVRPFGGPGTGSMGSGPMTPAAPYSATTDAEGKFRIENVDPGSYRMSAERQGFVRQEYGARLNSMMGTTVTVAPAQELKDLNFKLIPQAVITGRVLDEEGEPLAHVQIQVMAQRFFRAKRQLMPTGGAQTNDTGEFRVADLAPGRYWVSATYRGRNMMFGEAPARNTADKPEEEYVATYYPGSIDQVSARPLDVQAGQEMPGIDIRIQKTRVYRIRGKVTGAPQPIRNVRLIMLPRDQVALMGFFGGAGAMVKEDGTFEIGGVQPGSYYVAALPMQGPQSVSGKVAVDVSRENVQNVTLVLGSGMTVKGSILIEGDVQQPEQARGKKTSFGAVRVQLSVIEGLPFGASGGTVKDDGSFAIENVGPDRYRILALNLPEGTWLKSIRAGDQEVLDTGLDLSSGVSGPVQITLGSGSGQISGKVQDAKQQAAPGSLVTLLPNPMKEERNDLYRITTTDQNGQFTLQGVPPGEYRLYAWEDIEPGIYMDPEFLKPHESKAQKITIKANGQEQVSIAQISAEATAAK